MQSPRIYLRRTAKRTRLAFQLALPRAYVSAPGGWPKLRKRPGEVVFERFAGTRLARRFVSRCLAAIDTPFVLLDIGANLGAYSLYADRLPQCRAVFAFEPVPATFHDLVANLALNRATKATPLCAAVGAPGVAHLVYDPSHSGLSYVTDAGGTVTAPVLGAAFLDAVLADRPAARIVAKVDVEGAEIGVLRELAATRAFAGLSDLIVELRSHHQNPPGFLRDLKAAIAELGFVALVSEDADTHFRRALDAGAAP